MNTNNIGRKSSGRILGKTALRTLTCASAMASVMANAQTITLRSGDLSLGAGGVGTLDPVVRYSLQGGGSLNSGHFSNTGSWARASVCDDVRWGMKSRTPSFDKDAQWINPSGNSFNPQTALFAHSFNPGNASLMDITVKYVVDDSLGDIGNTIHGLYINGGPLMLTPGGSHTVPTTVSMTNVNVIPNTTNWLYFYGIDLGSICSGIMYTAELQTVPEPGSLLVLAACAAGAIARRRRKA